MQTGRTTYKIQINSLDNHVHVLIFHENWGLLGSCSTLPPVSITILPLSERKVQKCHGKWKHWTDRWRPVLCNTLLPHNWFFALTMHNYIHHFPICIENAKIHLLFNAFTFITWIQKQFHLKISAQPRCLLYSILLVNVSNPSTCNKY